MKITPLDIRHKEFKRGLRGYIDAEVDGFLDLVVDEYERLFKENIDLAERLEALNEKVSAYKRIEDALQKTLVSAQTSAEEVKQNATKAAQLVLHEAELKARQMIADAYSEKQTVEQATAKLKDVEQDFRFKFRQMLEGYLRQAEQAPEAAPGAALGLSEAQSAFARHADAIREAIARDEAVVLSSEVPPTPEVAEAAEDEGRPGMEATAGRVESTPEAAADEAPAVGPGPERYSGERSRALFGERDDLLADVDSGVSENEFKW